MIYEIEFVQSALDDLERHKKAGNKQLVKKISKLIEELRKHPTSGTGKPERLKYYKDETWSRRINHKHRLVYEIQETKILVLVLSMWGHYDDK